MCCVIRIVSSKLGYKGGFTYFLERKISLQSFQSKYLVVNIIITWLCFLPIFTSLGVRWWSQQSIFLYWAQIIHIIPWGSVSYGVCWLCWVTVKPSGKLKVKPSQACSPQSCCACCWAYSYSAPQLVPGTRARGLHIPLLTLLQSPPGPAVVWAVHTAGSWAQASTIAVLGYLIFLSGSYMPGTQYFSRENFLKYNKELNVTVFIGCMWETPSTVHCFNWVFGSFS